MTSRYYDNFTSGNYYEYTAVEAVYEPFNVVQQILQHFGNASRQAYYHLNHHFFTKTGKKSALGHVSKSSIIFIPPKKNALKEYYCDCKICENRRNPPILDDKKFINKNINFFKILKKETIKNTIMTESIENTMSTEEEFFITSIKDFEKIFKKYDFLKSSLDKFPTSNT